jgi:glutamate racemase
MKYGIPVSQVISNAPGRIGIFDSGVGGLTVLSEIYRQLPNESVLYFGDTARLPYGSRSPEEILYFVRQILTWMAAQQVKMVMMACNTSSVGERIGVIATEATVRSNAYKHAIQELAPDRQVWQVSCPQFVSIVEGNQIHQPHAQQVAATYLRPLLAEQIDTLIYGCTHYPHLAPVFHRILPTDTQYINPAISMVIAAAQELDALGLRSTKPAWSTEFYVSGPTESFKRLAYQWLGHQPRVSQIQLPALVMSR